MCSLTAITPLEASQKCISSTLLVFYVLQISSLQVKIKSLKCASCIASPSKWKMLREELLVFFYAKRSRKNNKFMEASLKWVMKFPVL